jgi:NAD(P)H-hydrate epimerase
VLTGIITSLLGQGYDALDAAVLGVFIHGAAGDYAKGWVGEISLIAGDLIDYLPSAFMDLEKLN